MKTIGGLLSPERVFRKQISAPDASCSIRAACPKTICTSILICHAHAAHLEADHMTRVGTRTRPTCAMPEGPKTSPSMRNGMVRCPGCRCASYAPKNVARDAAQECEVPSLAWSICTTHIQTLDLLSVMTLPREAGSMPSPSYFLRL